MLGARVLVAEDATINQLVARRMLERLGCYVDVVGNGHEVLEALEHMSYTMVLMDVQMPEMDGYEATAEIRRRESPSRHTPIVAMTANALKGDRERALAAGMDDYLSKPIRMADLDVLVRTWAPTSPATPTIVDAEVDSWLAEIYLREEPAIQAELRSALESGNAREVAFSAHRLRGTAAAVGANTLMALCADLEQRARDDSLDDLGQLLERLERASRAVRDALEGIGSTTPAA